jgi:hypothetical protein
MASHLVFVKRLLAACCPYFGRNLGKYALLPAGKYDAALSWLHERAAELLPDDADALPPLQEKLL